MTTFQPRTTTVKIYQGNVLDEIRELRERADAARDNEGSVTRRYAEVGDYETLRAEHNAKVDQANENAVYVKLRNLGRTKYRDLKAKFPPREEGVSERVKAADAEINANEDALFDALLPLSMLAPSFGSDAERIAFLEEVPPIDYERLKLAAFRLNETQAADPKHLPVFPETPESDET